MNVALKQSAAYRVMLPSHRRGMGTTGGGGTTSQLAAGATSAAGSVLITIAPFTGPAAPIIAAIGGIMMAASKIIAEFNGCGETCIEATAVVNQVGSAMTQAFQTYMSAPIHYISTQQAFLSYFTQLMTQLQAACGNPSLGTAGQNCIADNSPNACKWKASPGGWSQNSDGTWKYTYWGAAGSGDSCWNPYTGIYDMVLNDPTVVPDGTATAGGTPSVGTNSTTFATPTPVPPTTQAALPNLTSLLPSSNEGWLVLAGVGLALWFFL